jgi:hypothetical protein
MKKNIPTENRGPYGWWMASYIMRFEYYDEDRKNPQRRCLAWENTVILKAKIETRLIEKRFDSASCRTARKDGRLIPAGKARGDLND